MAVTAQTIIDRVRTQLIDTGTTQRWTDSELLKWLSDGQRSVVAFAPSASSTDAVLQLASGTKQSIPSDGHMLLTIVRNTDVTGTTGGRVCRIVTRELLDAQNPDWHNSSNSTTVQNYIFDPMEPKKFYVYPPNDGTGYVECVYSVMPSDLTSVSDVLDVQDIYQTALVDYVLFRAHQKDSDFAAGQAVAQNYLQLFLSYMGQGEASQVASNPNLQLTPPNPATKGTAR